MRTLSDCLGQTWCLTQWHPTAFTGEWEDTKDRETHLGFVNLRLPGFENKLTKPWLSKFKGVC